MVTEMYGRANSLLHYIKDINIHDSFRNKVTDILLNIYKDVEPLVCKYKYELPTYEGKKHSERYDDIANRIENDQQLKELLSIFTEHPVAGKFFTASDLQTVSDYLIDEDISMFPENVPRVVAGIFLDLKNSIPQTVLKFSIYEKLMKGEYVCNLTEFDIVLNISKERYQETFKRADDIAIFLDEKELDFEDCDVSLLPVY